VNSAFVCDGTIRSISLPLPPYGTSFPYDVYNLSGTNLQCSREKGTACGSQQLVQCLPYSDTIGPITESGDGSLFIRPSDPIIITVTEPSTYFTHISWVVYDVGTGGAKLVGNYGPDTLGKIHPPVAATHEWQPNGPQPDAQDNATYFCGTCGDCTEGQGIQNLQINAAAGLGFRSFKLSQLYEDLRCGATCFNLDGSYWTGMNYSCMTVRVTDSCKVFDLHCICQITCFHI
jgi:hypothetical protein